MRKTTSLLFALGLLVATAPHTYAQSNSRPDSDKAPTAQDALRMKAQSKNQTNPTEQNWTNPNTIKEQPGNRVPSAPKKMTSTGKTSGQMPPLQNDQPRTVTVPKTDDQGQQH